MANRCVREFGDTEELKKHLLAFSCLMYFGIIQEV